MPVIGIDLGCLGTKVATIGRGGVAIVRNDLADRVTPTLVGYTDNERLIGDAAFTSLKSNAARTVRNAKHFLGITDCAEDQELLNIERQYTLAKIVESANAPVAFEVGRKTGPVTAVEVLVPFLKKLKTMADSYIGAGVTGCVLSIPVWFSDVHRNAALEACKLADLPCLKVMPHSTATALDYGLFRRSMFTADEDHTVVFIDTGYGQTTVTVASYTPEGLTIRYTEEDPTLGGRAIDKILLTHLVASFKASSGIDVSKNVKAMLKLEEAAEKAKRVLSANRETNIHLECLAGDEDLSISLNREQFEKLIVEYIDRLGSRVTEVLTRAGKIGDLSNLASVEIVGGGTRVPAVQAKLETIFGRSVSRTLSADECVARGAAVQAAMLDPRHRVKPYEIKDMRQEGLCLRFNGLIPGDVVDERGKAVEVRQGRDIIPFCPGLSFTHSAQRKLVLPVPEQHTTFLQFDIRGFNEKNQDRLYYTVRLELPSEVRKAIEERPEKCRFELKAQVDLNAMSNIEGTVKEEVITENEVIERMPKRDEKGEIIEGEFDETKVKKPITTVRTHKLPQTVTRVPGFIDPGLRLKYSQMEAEESVRDNATYQARHTRNEILSKAFLLREVANGRNSTYEPFVTPVDRDLFLKVSEECELFAEENEGLSCEEYNPYMQKIQTAWSPVEERFRIAAQKAAEEEALAKRAAEEALAEAQKAAEAAAAAAAAETAAKTEPSADMKTEDTTEVMGE